MLTFSPERELVLLLSKLLLGSNLITYSPHLEHVDLLLP
jgi:hypothetical protein